jgi:hypothetical protein
MDEKPTSRAVTHEQEWDAAMAALREAGWQVEMTCFAAPVQLGRPADMRPHISRPSRGCVCCWTFQHSIGSGAR